MLFFPDQLRQGLVSQLADQETPLTDPHNTIELNKHHWYPSWIQLLFPYNSVSTTTSERDWSSLGSKTPQLELPKILICSCLSPWKASLGLTHQHHRTPEAMKMMMIAENNLKCLRTPLLNHPWFSLFSFDQKSRKVSGLRGQELPEV